MELIFKNMIDVFNSFCGKKRKRNTIINNIKKDFIENRMFIAKNSSKYHNYKNFDTNNLHSITQYNKSNLINNKKLMIIKNNREKENYISKSEIIDQKEFVKSDKNENLHIEINSTTFEDPFKINNDNHASIQQKNNMKENSSAFVCNLFSGDLSGINNKIIQEKSFDSWTSKKSILDLNEYENYIQKINPSEVYISKDIDNSEAKEFMKKNENLLKIGRDNTKNNNYLKDIGAKSNEIYLKSIYNDKNYKQYFPEYYKNFKDGKFKDKIGSIIFNKVISKEAINDNIMTDNSPQKNIHQNKVIMNNPHNLINLEPYQKLKIYCREKNNLHKFPLIIDEFLKIERIFQDTDNLDVSIFNEDHINFKKYLQISDKSFLTLKGKNWLNDEVINSYIELIIRRKNDILKKSERKYPRIEILNTFFFTQFEKENAYSFKKLDRIFLRKKIDFEKLDFLMIPISLKNTHWILCLVDPINYKIIYFDSLEPSRVANISYVSNVLISLFEKYLKDKKIENNKKERSVKIENEAESITQESILSEEIQKLSIENIKEPYLLKCRDVFPINIDNEKENLPKTKWKIIYANGPYQNNLYDCGVFVCKYMDYISCNAEFDFTNKEMDFFRKLIALELIRGELLFQ